MNEFEVGQLDKDALIKKVSRCSRYRYFNNLVHTFFCCSMFYLAFSGVYSGGPYALVMGIFWGISAIICLGSAIAVKVLSTKGWICSLCFDVLGFLVNSVLLGCSCYMSKMSLTEIVSEPSSAFLYAPVLYFMVLVVIVLTGRKVYRDYKTIYAEKKTRNVEFLTFSADFAKVYSAYNVYCWEKYVSKVGYAIFALAFVVSALFGLYSFGNLGVVLLMLGILLIPTIIILSMVRRVKTSFLKTPYKVSFSELKQVVSGKKENKYN